MRPDTDDRGRDVAADTAAADSMPPGNVASDANDLPAPDAAAMIARMRRIAIQGGPAARTWLEVEAHLQAAEHHAQLPTGPPLMTTLPPLLRRLGRIAARLVLRLSSFVTDVQTRYNLAAARTLRALVAQLRWSLDDAGTALPPPADMDALLAAMHARFRGSRELIAERLRVYLPLLEQAAAGAIHPVLLDLGSGRGELLELAQQYGWRARGAETNQAFVSECRQRGLDVLREEAVSCMRSLPAGSVRAVAALHLIEHLPFAHFVTLVDEAARVLAPGGVLLLETPNPDNLRVSTCTFHCDPTHQRPLPSAVVTFVVEARGLCRPQVLALHPADTAASEAMDAPAQLAEWLSGPQDYAVVAWKA